MRMIRVLLLICLLMVSKDVFCAGEKRNLQTKGDNTVKTVTVHYPQKINTFKVIKRDEIAGKILVEIEGKQIEADREEAFTTGEIVIEYPFNVYTEEGAIDNHYYPTGLMGDYGDLRINTKYDKDTHSGNTCIKIAYSVVGKSGPGWAGLYWQSPEKNWGMQIGGYCLTEAKRLTFWAKSEIGEEVINDFFVGGIQGEYSDTARISLGPVILTKEWKKYEIDLSKVEDTPEKIIRWEENKYIYSPAKEALSRISGGFGWATSGDIPSPRRSIIFYLDDIRYEK